MTPDITAVKVEQADLGHWWPLVDELLLPAVQLSNGRETLSTIFDCLADGLYQLFVCWDSKSTRVAAAVVVQFTGFRTGKVYLSILYLGGSGLFEFLPILVPKLVSYASANGAQGIEIHGRPGWQRALAPYGVKPSGITLLEVDLERKQFQRHQPNPTADSRPE